MNTKRNSGKVTGNELITYIIIYVELLLGILKIGAIFAVTLILMD